MNEILQYVGGLVALLTVQYFFKAFITLNFNVLLGPLVEQFWRHARAYGKHKHSARSPLECEDCAERFMGVPD